MSTAIKFKPGTVIPDAESFKRVKNSLGDHWDDTLADAEMGLHPDGASLAIPELKPALCPEDQCLEIITSRREYDDATRQAVDSNRRFQFGLLMARQAAPARDQQLLERSPSEAASLATTWKYKDDLPFAIRKGVVMDLLELEGLFYPGEPRHARRPTLLRRFCYQAGTFLVAATRPSGGVLGFCATPVAEVGEPNHVSALWVRPEVRRKGVGTQLLRRASRGCSVQSASSYSDEEDGFWARARKFYIRRAGDCFTHDR